MSIVFQNLAGGDYNLSLGEIDTEILSRVADSSFQTIKQVYRTIDSQQSSDTMFQSVAYMSFSISRDSNTNKVRGFRICASDPNYIRRNYDSHGYLASYLSCSERLRSMGETIISETVQSLQNFLTAFPTFLENETTYDFKGGSSLYTHRWGNYSDNKDNVLKLTGTNNTLTNNLKYPEPSYSGKGLTKEVAWQQGALYGVGYEKFETLDDIVENLKNRCFRVIKQPYPLTVTSTTYYLKMFSISSFSKSASSNGYPFTNITADDLGYTPESPDGSNTYPGGGNDKNTYPDDESGKGTFDNTNDPIDFPDMPLWDATSTGFISMYSPEILEIIALYGFLWDSDIGTTLKKLFLEPMDAIISLAFFPVDPSIDDQKRLVSIGHVDTGITMNHVNKQFVDFDFGEINVDEYYGAAWDYSPYTNVSIYLPYIGVQPVDIDDVMNANLHLKYRVDLLSGMCSAMLKVSRSRDGLDAIVYTWQGNCAMFVPITAGSAREFINSIIQVGAMAGVALAQPAAGAIENRANRDVEDYKAPSLGGNWINPAMSAYSTLNVLGQKVHVQRGGRVDSNAGVMSPQQAYIILTRPVSAIPKGWNKYAGYPSLKIKKLSTQKGYTEIAYIKLNNLEATAEEISELNSILRGGVIL